MTCVNRQVPAIYYRNVSIQRYMTIKYSIIKHNISVILTCAVYTMTLAILVFTAGRITTAKSVSSQAAREVVASCRGLLVFFN